MRAGESADEARTLLDATRGDRLEALFVLAVSTGLREGELLALRWEDLEAAVLPQSLPEDPAQARRSAGYPLPRPEAYMRHPAALPNVNPKIVSEMLGHATIAITLDTYSHVLPSMQQTPCAPWKQAL